jgi:hypothetical protein
VQLLQEPLAVDKRAAKRAVEHPTGKGQPEASVTLSLDEFAYRTIEEESAKMGVSVEELSIFAVLYYLADLDSGRIARRIPAR